MTPAGEESCVVVVVVVVVVATGDGVSVIAEGVAAAEVVVLAFLCRREAILIG